MPTQAAEAPNTTYVIAYQDPSWRGFVHSDPFATAENFFLRPALCQALHCVRAGAHHSISLINDELKMANEYFVCHSATDKELFSKMKKAQRTAQQLKPAYAAQELANKEAHIAHLKSHYGKDYDPPPVIEEYYTNPAPARLVIFHSTPFTSSARDFASSKGIPFTVRVWPAPKHWEGSNGLALQTVNEVHEMLKPLDLECKYYWDDESNTTRRITW